MPRGDIHERYTTTKFANGDYLNINNGNELGCTFPHQIGSLWACTPDRILMNKQGTWKHKEDDVRAYLVPKDCDLSPDKAPGYRHFWSVRMAGMSPVSQLGDIETEPDTYWGNEVSYYSKSTIGHTCYIEADIGAGVTIEWELDATRNYACTRSSLVQDGEVVMEALTDYEQFGDLWFPMNVSYVNDSGAEFRRIRVLYASFDDPAHPRELTVNEHLDFVPGTIISDESKDTSSYWDGRQIISFEDYSKRLGKDIDDTEARRRWLATMTDEAGAYPKQISDDKASRELGLWESYVRTFIFKYHLDKEQSKKAWDHLAKCRKPAYEFMKENKERYDKITTDINDRATRRTQSEDDREKDALSEEITELTDHRDRLLEPIQRIFENQLKPGLEKLPTKAQKEQAGANAAATLAKAEEDAKKRSAKYLEMLQQSRRPPQSQPSDK
jgi:hypothetical protein